MNELLFKRVFEVAKWGMLLTSRDGQIIASNRKCTEWIPELGQGIEGKFIHDVLEFDSTEGSSVDFQDKSALIKSNGRRAHITRTSFSDHPHILFQIEVQKDLDTEETIASGISSEHKLQLATNAGEIGIWEYHVDTKKLFWNDDMFAIYEVDHSEFKGEYIDWEKRLHPEDAQMAEEAVKIASETGENFNYTFRIITGTGAIKYVKASAKVLKDASGKSTHMFGINTDVTESMNLQLLLQEKAINDKRFIEQSPHAIAMFNTKMEYLAASQVWIENNGLEGVDLIGKSQYEMIPESATRWKSVYEDCLNGAVRQSDRERITRKDGSEKFVKWDIRPWLTEDEEIGGILIHVDDITEWMQRMDEKNAVEKILNDTQSVARIGSWEFNLLTNQLKWDSITREIHEVPDDFKPDVAKGVNFYKEGDSRNAISDALDKAISDGDSWDLELQLITYTGREIWCRAVGQAELNTEGECIRLYGLFQDINAQKMAEANLRLSEKRFKQAFEDSAIGMALVALTGEWLQVNNKFSEMIGYTEAELQELTFQDLTHPDDLDTDLKYLQRAIDDEIDSYQMQKRYYHKNGDVIWAMMSVALIKDGDSLPVHLVSQIEDITQRVESEHQLTEANTKLQELALKLSGQNKRLANFAHITSHNLRAPVSNLSALMRMHQASDSDEEKALIFKKFDTVIDHLSSTLNELVEALIIKEKGEDEVSSVVLEDVFEKISETLTGQIMNSEARLESDFSAFKEVQFNKAYMESIMLNIISNAIKYKSPERSPVIRVFTEERNGGHLLHFQDNGLGIDLAKHGKKMFGLHKTFHEHPEAKGVGLFLVKTQVEASGGEIRVSSEPGKGTRFTIRFEAQGGQDE